MNDKNLFNKRGRFFQIDNEIFDFNLDTYELSVYFYLTKCAGIEGAAFPSLSHITKKLKISRPKVVKSLKTLISKSLIIKYQKKVTNGVRNIYLIQDIKQLIYKNDSEKIVNELYQVNEITSASNPDELSLVNDVNLKNTHCKNTKEKNKKEYTQEFLTWFNNYPKERDKTKARAFKWWQKRTKREIKYILLATEEYKKYIDQERTKNSYIICSANFIGRDERYIDFIPEEKELVKPKEEKFCQPGGIPMTEEEKKEFERINKQAETIGQIKYEPV